MRNSTIRPSHILPMALAVIGVWFAFSTPAGAQVISRLEGTVTDESGNPLEGAEIFLKNTQTNATLKPAKTKKTGKYLYMAEPANYIIWAKLEGYMVARQIVDITNSAGGNSVNTWFFDEKQTFDKPIHLLAQGDLGSKVKQRIDFVLTTPDKHATTVNKLYAEFKGGGQEGGDAAAPAAAAPAEQKKGSWELAIEKLEQKDYEGAIPLLKTAAEEKPEDVDVYYQLGRAGVETENWTEAEPALKKAKQIDPTKPGVSFQLARLYDKKGRKVQALQALEEEKALSPDSQAVLDNLGRIYSETGQNDKAVESLEALIAAHPDHLDAYVTLANVYKTMGDKAKEEAVYQRMGAMDPKGDALYNLGNLAFNRNEPDKAIVYYKQVLEKNPNHPKAHLQLAYTMVNLGDFPGAISHFESFLKLSPKDDRAAEAKAVMDELKKMSGKGSGKS